MAVCGISWFHWFDFFDLKPDQVNVVYALGGSIEVQFTQ